MKTRKPLTLLALFIMLLFSLIAVPDLLLLVPRADAWIVLGVEGIVLHENPPGQGLAA